MTSTTTARQPSKPLDLELTILSAKHLKNVNWRNGDIKPYVVFWLDSDRRLSTKPDHSGSTKPVWNETFTLPINLPLNEALLSLEILHSKPSETPNPLIGSVRIHLKDVFDGSGIGTLVRKFELRRPSGRPQGKIFIKLAVSERDLPDYAPPNPYYYSATAQPTPPARDYRQYPPSPYPSQFPPLPSQAPAPYYGGYPQPYPGYYSGYYQQPPPAPQDRPPYFDRQSSYGGPSAPVDYAGYDQKQKGSGKLGIGSGVPVGAVAEGFCGLAIHEGVESDEDKVAVDRVERDLSSKDGQALYHAVKYKYDENKHGADRVDCDLASRDAYSHYRSEY